LQLLFRCGTVLNIWKSP